MQVERRDFTMRDRKQHWEKVYATKPVGEASWYQAEPKLSLELIHNAGIGHDLPIIDIGGGTSNLVDRLQAQGYRHLAVLDISGTALAFAKKRLGLHASAIEWFEADITLFASPHRFSLWHDRAVLHFLTNTDDRQRYIKVLKATLAEGGQAIIAAFAIGGPTRCSGLDIVQYDAAKLGKELGDEFVLQEEHAEKHLTPNGNEQRFGFFRFMRVR